MPIEEAQYGYLKAYYKSWGIFEGQDVHFEELPWEYCTRAQLNLEESGADHPDSLFFPTHKNSMTDINYYWQKFKCIKQDKLRIQGDYNAARTRSLVLQFEMCTQTPDSPVKCKSKQEIKEWLQRKFIVTYVNQRRFRLEAFDESKIVEESRTNWIPLNS